MADPQFVRVVWTTFQQHQQAQRDWQPAQSDRYTRVSSVNTSIAEHMYYIYTRTAETLSLCFLTSSIFAVC